MQRGIITSILASPCECAAFAASGAQHRDGAATNNMDLTFRYLRLLAPYAGIDDSLLGCHSAVMTPLRMRFIKTVQLLILVNSAFTLGSYSETFSGSKWAWI